MGRRQPGVVLNELIAVDKFPRNNMIKYYFLSHAHSDHCAFLDNKWRNGDIYCSPITAEILPSITRRAKSKRIGVKRDYIHALELNFWHQMDGFAVMLLDANHIAGSVMFLFDGDRFPDGPVLFTGDFRADEQFYKNVFGMSVLQEKRLSTIYLDDTYINSTRQEFPSRKASLIELFDCLRQVIFDGANPVVIVVPGIGRDQLLVDIAIEFKCKIWVDSVRWEIMEILDLNGYFTTKQDEAFIWACTRKDGRRMLGDANSCVIEVTMLPSIKPDILINNERMFHVEYSDHCSPNEIRDFLSQLTFSRVFGLSAELSPEQIDSLERLSLTNTNASSIFVQERNNEMANSKELCELISPTVLSRTGLAFDYALRSVFAVETSPDDLTTATARKKTTVKSNEISRKASNRSYDDSESVQRPVEEENDNTFDAAISEILKTVNVENLASNIYAEMNENTNTEKNDPLREFVEEMDFSKALENLGDVYEEYREAVNMMAEKRIDISLPFSAKEHVAYVPSAGLSLPKWLNLSESDTDDGPGRSTVELD